MRLVTELLRTTIDISKTALDDFDRALRKAGFNSAEFLAEDKKGAFSLVSLKAERPIDPSAELGRLIGRMYYPLRQGKTFEMVRSAITIAREGRQVAIVYHASREAITMEVKAQAGISYHNLVMKMRFVRVDTHEEELKGFDGIVLFDHLALGEMMKQAYRLGRKHGHRSDYSDRLEETQG